jgi:hypothetical protein
MVSTLMRRVFKALSGSSAVTSAENTFFGNLCSDPGGYSIVEGKFMDSNREPFVDQSSVCRVQFCDHEDNVFGWHSQVEFGEF